MKQFMLKNGAIRHVMCMALVMVGMLFTTPVMAKEALNTPLDPDNPVYFYGDSIEYKGETVALGKYNIYIDPTLSDEICAQYNYVFNDFKEAYEEGGIVSGTSSEPMNVYLAPYVYWIDDPDDEEIRQGVNGDKVPYGLWMNCSYLSLNGLTDNPDKVVLAVNRGQNAGAIGNFTMFYINGTGTHTENLTMGNYCCVDLEYPLKPELSREKRTSTITQSQLVLTNGSKITAENCNFISRLNSCPFVGGTRIFFEDCHFECTDDSLPTSAVYLNCDFEFYSSKPFYSTSGTGSVFLGCTFHIMHGASQYFTKAGGVVAIIDGTFHCSKKGQYIGWTPAPANSLRCYESNVTVNYTYMDEEGKEQKETVSQYQIDADAPYDNVDIAGKEALHAYRVESDGKVIYNVYNLLKGNDEWDPLGQKEIIKAASPQDKDYTNMPTILSCSPAAVSITNGGTQKITTSMSGFSNAISTGEAITWEVEDVIKDYITLTDHGDSTCSLKCKNTGLTPVKGMVYAYGESGLSAGVYVTAAPKTQDAPKFIKAPALTLKSGVYNVSYSLPNEKILNDMSVISWYRCSDSKGEDAVLVAVTTNNNPKKTYTLTNDDIGYYIKAVVMPKQLCTYTGNAVSVVSKSPVKFADVKEDSYHFYTDFSDFATSRQQLILPGFWTRDVYKAWLADASARPTDLSGWMYGLGAESYGAEGLYGLLPSQRGSRLLYTPLEGDYGNMNLTLVVNPEKNAGQGFGSAGQYMDIMIKYDTTTLTGYALRLERVTSTAKGVQAALVEYKNDTVTYISDKVLTSAFNAECTIRVAVEDGTFSAMITTTHVQSEEQIKEGLQHVVQLEAQIKENAYGGFGILDTGTPPAGNRIMFNSLEVEWDKEGVDVDYDKVKAVNLGTPWNLANGAVSCPTSCTYTAKPIIPALKVTFDGRTLVKNKDYTLAFKNNLNIGTATITITGKGDYSGTIQKTFRIIPKIQKVGTTFSSGNLKFKITGNATNGSGTVTVTGATKNSLKSIEIKGIVTYQGVTYKITDISKNAFTKCKKLQSITIGANVKTIGANAFKGCGKLKKITISSKVLNKVGKNALKGIQKNCVIKVPSSKLKKYKTLLKGKGQAKTVKIKK